MAPRRGSRARLLTAVGVSLTLLAAVAPSPGLATGPLVVTLSSYEWTWHGTGSPCTPGSNLTAVVILFGNASGGVPPYAFSWNFGDGTNNSSGPQVDHVFATNEGRWNVTLTATDSTGASANSSEYVWAPSINCPAENVHPSSPPPAVVVGTLSAGLVGAAAAGLLAAAIVIWSRRKPRV